MRATWNLNHTNVCDHSYQNRSCRCRCANKRATGKPKAPVDIVVDKRHVVVACDDVAQRGKPLLHALHCYLLLQSHKKDTRRKGGKLKYRRSTSADRDKPEDE